MEVEKERSVERERNWKEGGERNVRDDGMVSFSRAFTGGEHAGGRAASGLGFFRSLSLVPASAWLLFKSRCESFLINGGNNGWKIRNPRGTP